MKLIGRSRPYSRGGIRRVPCARCGQPSSQQWQVCALDNRYMGCCQACDVGLNKRVLAYFRIPNAANLIGAYRKQHPKTMRAES